MTNKPIIGITCDFDSGGSRDSILIGRGCHYLPDDYSKKISALGGIPLLITPSNNHKDNNILLSMCDGVLLTGGRSIDPDIYGKEPSKDGGSLSMERYRKEMPFIREALGKGMPILGICAGHQAINIACGGNLNQDIKSLKKTTIAHDQHAPRKEPTHYVKIEKESTLRKILGKNKIRVNSFHQQSIDKLGKNIVITSKSLDGIVESIEMKDRKNVMGIQWHPESLEDGYSNKIFKHFIKLCK